MLLVPDKYTVICGDPEEKIIVSLFVKGKHTAIHRFRTFCELCNKCMFYKMSALLSICTASHVCIQRWSEDRRQTCSSSGQSGGRQ